LNLESILLGCLRERNRGNKKNSNYSGSQIIDITCNFLIIFTVNPKVPLTVSPRQFKIFAQMPKMSSWKV